MVIISEEVEDVDDRHGVNSEVTWQRSLLSIGSEERVSTGLELGTSSPFTLTLFTGQACEDGHSHLPATAWLGRIGRSTRMEVR